MDLCNRRPVIRIDFSTKTCFAGSRQGSTLGGLSAGPFRPRKAPGSGSLGSAKLSETAHLLIFGMASCGANKLLHHAMEPSPLSQPIATAGQPALGPRRLLAGGGNRGGGWGGRDWAVEPQKPARASLGGGHDSSRPRAPVTPFAPNNKFVGRSRLLGGGSMVRSAATAALVVWDVLTAAMPSAEAVLIRS